MKGGTGYTFDAFWIECPQVKTSYRRNEHGLQAAETISTIASLHSGFTYPIQTLYESWILMLLNMDRNTLWGSAGGMVFESENSWDVHDRMEYVGTSNKKVHAAALSSISPEGEAAALFNPLNWERNDPVVVELPEGKGLEGVICQTTPDGKTLCSLRLPSVGVAGVRLETKSPETSKKIELPESIETRHYTARIDWKTGALVSLKLKPSGREILGGPANVLVAEKPKPQKEDYGDFMSWRPDRTRLASSSDFKPTVTVSSGPLATTVEVASEFYGGAPSRRVMRFYKDFPRIDFETEVQDIPNITVVVSEFPLARRYRGSSARHSLRFLSWGLGQAEPGFGGLDKGHRAGGALESLQPGGRRRSGDPRPGTHRPGAQRKDTHHLPAERHGKVLWISERLAEWQRPTPSGIRSGCARRPLGSSQDSPDGLGIQLSSGACGGQKSDGGEVIRSHLKQRHRRGGAPGG